MPYYWSRICNIYEGAPDGWETSNNAILSDLAWFVIEDESNPQMLCQAVQDAYDKDEDFRPPYPDEDGLFKTWYDEILVSEASIDHRDSLMATLFLGSWDEQLSSANASYMVHMLPSETIIGFMENIKERIQTEQDDTETVDTNEIQAHDEEDDYNSDSDSDSDSNNESEEEEEAEELRTNQWTRICHQWQHNITPRIYQEILRGTGGWRPGTQHLRNYMNQFPLLDQNEPMDISDEDSDVEMRNHHTFHSQSIRV